MTKDFLIRMLPRRASSRRHFPLFFLCALLCACNIAPRQAQTPPVRYDLGPVSTVTTTAPAAGSTSRNPVFLALEVRLPSWLDSTAMHYRLLYEDQRQVHEYAFSRWAAAPSQLLAQRLQSRLGEAPPVSSAPCLLRIDIEEFGQSFDSAAASHGIIAARVSLLDKKRQSLAQTRYHGEYPAVTADAQGGVVALTAVADDLAATLVRWRGELAAGEMLKSCQP